MIFQKHLGSSDFGLPNLWMSQLQEQLPHPGGIICTTWPVTETHLPLLWLLGDCPNYKYLMGKKQYMACMCMWILSGYKELISFTINTMNWCLYKIRTYVLSWHFVHLQYTSAAQLLHLSTIATGRRDVADTSSVTYLSPLLILLMLLAIC